MVQQFQQEPEPKRHTRVKAESRYPVYDLGSSIDLALAIRDKGGGAATQQQLGSFLSYKSIKSGAFITRLAAARLFGLVESRDQLVVLTALATAIIAPERPGVDDRRARLQAFMNVPLYKSLYDRWMSGQLPPEAGMRNALENHYGVPRARTQIAYRVVMDSAGKADLYESRGGARTHWVTPTIGDDEAAKHLQDAVPPAPDEAPGGLTQPQPELKSEVEVDDATLLKRILMDKIRQVDASDLDKVKEYIRLIEEIGEGREDEPKPE